MSDDEIDRNTAIGFYHYAHSYAASAIALSEIRVRSTHPDAVVRYLYRHAVELYLKAWLRGSGLSEEDLRIKYGHSTAKLLDAALAAGLTLNDGHQTYVRALNDALSDRYLTTGTRRILSDEQAAELCRNLNLEIGIPLYRTAKINRPPMAL